MEKAADFFAGGRKKAEKNEKKAEKLFIESSPKRYEKYTVDRNKFYH